MTRSWLSFGVALLLTACGGAAVSGSGDGGEDGARGDAPIAEDSGHAGVDSSTGEDAESGADAGLADTGAADTGAHDAHDSGVKDAVADTGAAVDAADSGVVDAGSDAPWVIGVPTDVPQVQNNGGAVIAAPVLQSITFPGYDQTAAIDDLVATVGSTAYWQGAVGEYGVGPATAKPPVHLTTAAPTTIDDAGIQTWLVQLIGSTPGLMAPSANALYVISYPSTTTVTAFSTKSCTGFGGYHNSATSGGITFAYAVIPECTYAPSTTLQTTTRTLSHELAEATTDPQPLPFSASTFQGTDSKHTFWEVIVGGDGEVGDMCASFTSSYFQPTGFAYSVQRIWSNKAARQGHNPCQPELPGEVYFSSVPLLPDLVTIQWSGQGYPTEGVQIAVGASKTIPVQLYSEGPTAPWTVAAVDDSTAGTNLTFAWDKTTGQNGDTLHLTITVKATDATYGGNAFHIGSSSGSFGHTWYGFVGR